MRKGQVTHIANLAGEIPIRHWRQFCSDEDVAFRLPTVGQGSLGLFEIIQLKA